MELLFELTNSGIATANSVFCVLYQHIPQLQIMGKKTMTINAGNIVSHAGALEWGVGKVLEVTDAKATIHFSDGKSRKIAASHFNDLRPAAADSYIPPPEEAPVVKTGRPPRTTKKKK